MDNVDLSYLKVLLNRILRNNGFKITRIKIHWDDDNKPLPVVENIDFVATTSQSANKE